VGTPGQEFLGKLPLGGNRSFLEVGYVFNRRLNFVRGTPPVNPTEGWMISAGHTW